jgi:hypothetical protein
MAVVITHSTPADASFSTEGATAWNADHTLSGVGTLAEQNANAVAITGGTINNTPIGGTTPAAAVFTTLTATGQTSLGGAAGSESLRIVPVASSAQFIEVYGATGQTPYFLAAGANANINLALSSKGASAGASNIRFFTNGLLQEQFRVAHTASAVNYVQVTGAGAGSPPIISSQGATTPDLDLTITPKGAGRVNITTSIKPKVNSAANVTSPLAWNSTSFDEYAITALANALTINADANASPADGQRMLFRFKDNGTARALTWTTGSANSFRVVGVTLPTTTVISKLVYVGCVYNAADSRWDAIAVGQEA